MIDALLQTVRADYRFRTPALAALDPSRRLVLVTTHRRESFGAPLRSICAAIRELGARFPELQFVLPVHPNPEVKRTVESLLCDLPGMHLIDAGGLPRVRAPDDSRLPRADRQRRGPGGGAVARQAGAGAARGHRAARGRRGGDGAWWSAPIGSASSRRRASCSPRRGVRPRMANAVNPYGDGHASERILAALAARFG